MKVIIKSRTLGAKDKQPRKRRGIPSNLKFLKNHYDWQLEQLKLHGFFGNLTPEQNEALLDDVSKNLVDGFRNLDEAREYVVGKKPNEFVFFSPAGFEVNAHQLLWAIDREETRMKKLEESLNKVKVVSPSGRETGLGTMVFGLSKMLKKRGYK